MKRTTGIVVSVLVFGLFSGQVSADLVKFLSQDEFGSYTVTEQERKQQLRQRIRTTSTQSNYLPRMVKIGSHVLRERLVQAGCSIKGTTRGDQR